ncbi:HIT domain-containing protein [Methylobacterium durans]|uniref:HIT family hydrolase n=1 Tax=Methylobacterium durans TaxID=2202825 RepID=A0A2U8W778_9HYPH|nr:HIT domain-containing protein [Methylobacterium durans]AWN41166.1 HIT family hydrolase [Methylobacterium durans]
MTSPFHELRRFITEQMRMSHIYQPLMLKALLEGGGWASTRTVASAFLERDESQIDYYSEIVKRMPGRVLAAHGLVEREGSGFRLIPDALALSEEEKAQLLRLCDDAVAAYVEKRGKRLYAHRQAALGFISGNDRYEVLKGAGYRCELCGVPADERFLHVDHIIPRRHGGSDDRANLQALCYQCNGNKGAKDATDFRAVRAESDAREASCPFCDTTGRELVAENSLAVAFRDLYPVTPLHTLVIPRRHAATFFDLYEPERRAMNLLLDEARSQIRSADPAVTGFNIGMNCGDDAGQTVPHAHIHLIPRRRGDVEQPRGGVRGVIPGKANY